MEERCLNLMSLRVFMIQNIHLAEEVQEHLTQIICIMLQTDFMISETKLKAI